MKITHFIKFMILCLIIGCRGNGFTVDENKKALNMTSVWFSIRGDEGTASYYLKESSFRKDIKQIFLLKNNPDYRVDINGSICCKLNDSTFIFKPRINQEYAVTNYSNGDASSCTVRIIFDSLYNVHVVQFKYQPEKYIDTSKEGK